MTPELVVLLIALGLLVLNSAILVAKEWAQARKRERQIAKYGRPIRPDGACPGCRATSREWCRDDCWYLDASDFR